MKKKSAGTTPQARSLKYLRDNGWLAETVERWKSFPARGKFPCPACRRPQMVQVRVDLLNFADIIAFHPKQGKIILVQVTTTDNQAARLTKIVNDPDISLSALKVLHSGCEIWIHGWMKSAKDNRWKLTQQEVTRSMVATRAHAWLAAEDVQQSLLEV